MQKVRNLRNRWVNFPELSKLDCRNHDEFDAKCQKHLSKTKANCMKFWAQFFGAVKILVYRHYSNATLPLQFQKCNLKAVASRKTALKRGFRHKKKMRQ